jgi:hypothetical protein
MVVSFKMNKLVSYILVAQSVSAAYSLSSNNKPQLIDNNKAGAAAFMSRRNVFGVVMATALTTTTAHNAWALTDESKTPDSFDVDNYLRTGMVASPMGVSGQAGKSRPETGM